MEQVIRKNLVRGTEAGSLGGNSSLQPGSQCVELVCPAPHPGLVVVAPWLCITPW